MESHVLSNLIPVGGFTIVREKDGSYSLFKGMERFAHGRVRTDILRRVCADLPYHSLADVQAKYSLPAGFFEKDPASV